MKESQEPRVCDGVPLHHIAVEIMCVANGAGGQGQRPCRLSLDTTIHIPASELYPHTYSVPLGGLLLTTNM